MVRSMDETQSRWKLPLVSSTSFRAFFVTGGNIQPTPHPLRPEIEFLGDSITEGVNVWTSHNGQTRKGWRDDARIAYPSQTAQMLGAEWRQVGFGYLGILKDGNGGVPKANDSFNWIYQYVAAIAGKPTWLSSWRRQERTPVSRFNVPDRLRGTQDGHPHAYPDATVAALRPFNGAQAAPIRAAGLMPAWPAAICGPITSTRTAGSARRTTPTAYTPTSKVVARRRARW